MPPLRLTNLLQGALAHVSPASRAVLSTLGCRNGDAPSANEVAAWVGLRNRQQLARALQRDGLPPLERLAGWTRVLYWMLEAESTGMSLFQLARRDNEDPAVAYRLVRRVTGLRWSQARKAGVRRALSWFLDERHARTTGPGQSRHVSPRLATAAEHRGDVVTIPSCVETVPPPRDLGPRHPHGELAGRVAVPGGPFDVAIAPYGIVCVTRTHAAAIECLAPQPLRVLGRIHTGPVPTRLVFDPSSAAGYVTLQFADEVGALVVPDGRQVRSIPVRGNPLALCLAANGGTLFVTTNLDLLCRIDAVLGRVTASRAIPQAGFDLALHPFAPLLYANTWKAGLILEVDTRTMRTVRTFDVGGRPQDMVVSPDGAVLYAANEDGRLDAIRLDTGRSLARVNLGSTAISLALSPDGAVLYAGLVFAGRVAVVDRSTLRVTSSIVTHGKPRRIAFAAAGHAAFIANELGWVDVVH
jgi:YVTN family beta-propeller protein